MLGSVVGEKRMRLWQYKLSFIALGIRRAFSTDLAAPPKLCVCMHMLDMYARHIYHKHTWTRPKNMCVSNFDDALQGEWKQFLLATVRSL